MKASKFQGRKPECKNYVRGPMAVYDLLFVYVHTLGINCEVTTTQFVEGCFHWLTSLRGRRPKGRERRKTSAQSANFNTLMRFLIDLLIF